MDELEKRFRDCKNLKELEKFNLPELNKILLFKENNILRDTILKYNKKLPNCIEYNLYDENTRQYFCIKGKLAIEILNDSIMKIIFEMDYFHNKNELVILGGPISLGLSNFKNFLFLGKEFNDISIKDGD